MGIHPSAVMSADIHGFRGCPGIPWMLMDSIDTHECHGHPWASTDSMDIDKLLGHPCVPWMQVYSYNPRGG